LRPLRINIDLRKRGLPTETHFHIGAFDRAVELQPTRHVFREEQLPWLHLGETERAT
jgi:hypothetical protein